MTRKGGSGRKKTSLTKIENAASLQVSLAKRRVGIFNKANEIGTICGAEVAVVLFSPGGKVSTFGHPNVDQVIERFVTQNPPQEGDNNERMVEAYRQVQQLNLARKLSELNDLLDAEKKRGEYLNRILKLNEGGYLWGRPLEELNLHELDHFKKVMQVSKQNLDKQLELKQNPAPFLSLPAASGQPSDASSHPEFNRNKSDVRFGPTVAGPSGGANPSNWAPGSSCGGSFYPK